MKKLVFALALLSFAAFAAAYWFARGYGSILTSQGPAYFSFKAFQMATTAYGGGGAAQLNVSNQFALAIGLSHGTGAISGSTATLDGPGYIYRNGGYEVVQVTLTATDNGSTGDTFSITAHTSSGDVSIGGTLAAGQVVVGQG